MLDFAKRMCEKLLFSAFSSPLKSEENLGKAISSRQLKTNLKSKVRALGHPNEDTRQGCGKVE